MTLDPDVEALLIQTVQTQGITFKQAVNDVIRRGSQLRKLRTYTVTRHMGEPAVNLDRALQVDADLDDAGFRPVPTIQPDIASFVRQPS